MNSKALTALVAALSASAGAAATLWLSGQSPAAPQVEPRDDGEIAELRERVDDLERKLQQAIIASADTSTPAPSLQERKQPEASEPQPAPATAQDRATSWQRSQERRDQRERGQLLVAGWTEPEIDELQRLRESAQLKRLEQQHLAARDLRAKYPEATRIFQMRDPLRDELGDDKYGAYLEAVGRPTAVRVARLVPESAGETAGLREGDMIRSYAGERVFNRNELEQATLSGEYGETVTIEVERDGTVYYMSIPRGPIGTSLGMWN